MHCLLECARNYFESLNGEDRDDFRLVHVSTDEVYGTLNVSDDPFTEQKSVQTE